MAVTAEESSDGIRENATASIEELETGSNAARWSSPEGAESDKTEKANVFARALVGMIKKEGGINVASDSKSKLWRDMSLKRAVKNEA